MEIATASAIMLGIAAIIGLGLTTLQLRNLVAQRKMDMLVRLSPWFDIDLHEWQDISNSVLSCEFKDYDDFVGKYGPLSIDKPLPRAMATLSNFYEGIGILLRRKLIEKELIYDFYGGMVIASWEKMRPIIYEARKENPDSWSNFEFLYHSMMDLENGSNRRGSIVNDRPEGVGQ